MTTKNIYDFITRYPSLDLSNVFLKNDNPTNLLLSHIEVFQQMNFQNVVFSEFSRDGRDFVFSCTWNFLISGKSVSLTAPHFSSIDFNRSVFILDDEYFSSLDLVLFELFSLQPQFFFVNPQLKRELDEEFTFLFQNFLRKCVMDHFSSAFDDIFKINKVTLSTSTAFVAELNCDIFVENELKSYSARIGRHSLLDLFDKNNKNKLSNKSFFEDNFPSLKEKIVLLTDTKNFSPDEQNFSEIFYLMFQERIINHLHRSNEFRLKNLFEKTFLFQGWLAPLQNDK